MATKPRIKSDAIRTPNDQAEAEEFIAKIGELQRDVSRINDDMNDQLSVIKQSFEEQAQPLNTEIEELFSGVKAWAETNRDNLLKGKLKTVKVASGEISWRITPPRVSVRGADKVIDALKTLGLDRFLRTKQEVNKDQILAEPDAVVGVVAGIGITQKEEFIVKPFESEIEKAVTIG